MARSVARSIALALAASAMACAGPHVGRDGTVTFAEKGGDGASVLTANGVEYRDRHDPPQRVVVRDPSEPWRAPIGFIMPRDGRFTATSVPHVLSTQGLEIVLRPSDTRVPSWGGEVLVRVDLVVPAAEGTARWGENVALVVDGKSEQVSELVDEALAQLGARDRVTIVDAHGARIIVPPMPASNRSMAVAAVRTRLLRERPKRDFVAALRAAGTAVARSKDVTQRVLVLSDTRLAQTDATELATLGQRGVQIAAVSTADAQPSDPNDEDEARAALRNAVRAAIPTTGMTAFRDVRLTFEGTPAPSHVIEASGGEARWKLDAGELVIGNLRAGEARTEVLRVSIPAWVPGEKFHFTVHAHVDDLAWGGPREFSAEVPCVYDDDIERIAKSRHGDVIAYASALATLRRLDHAFSGDGILRAGGLRKIAQMHAQSMKLLARDTRDVAAQEQADMLSAILEANGGS